MCQPFLIPLLDRSPLLSESGVFSERNEVLEFGEVLEPDGLFDFQSLGNQVAKLGVALVEPSARGDFGKMSTE